MTVAKETRRYCIIGAGASGLAVAKAFVARNIPFVLLERESDLGGLWNIATDSGIVYESTHLVSSISSTGFEALPMLDADYPEYPSHARVMGYFREFAQRFGIMPHVRFNQRVTRVEQTETGSWTVAIEGEAQPGCYAGVVVANGHHDIPRMPTYPGAFTGETMHSRHYKSQTQVAGRRVLVVGAGNSACDIIRDAAHAAGTTVTVSMRRPTWFVPKFLLGFPTHDVVSTFEALPLPRAAKRLIFKSSLWLLQGPPSRYRLPDPDYPIDAAHPTMSDEIPRLAAHGRIDVKPEIARFDGADVAFVDGTRVAADLIVYATGYEPAIPFLDKDLAWDGAGRSTLHLNTLHPTARGLFFAGLVQANGSIWRLAEAQGDLIADAIVAQALAPGEFDAFGRAIAAQPAQMPAGRFVQSARHRLETNYYDYLKVLRRARRRHFSIARKLNLAQPTADSAANTVLDVTMPQDRAA